MNMKLLNYFFGCIILVIILINFIIFILKKYKVNLVEKDHLKYSLNNLKFITIFKKFFINKTFLLKLIIFLILLLTTIFTRFNKIDILLNGLHVDEVGMGYDAFCIANYGVDRYLNKFPIYMINFGRWSKCFIYIFICLFYKNIWIKCLFIKITTAYY